MRQSLFMPTPNSNNASSIKKIVNALDAMQIAQLCAFAFSIPQLYLCRLYLDEQEQVVIDACIVRLEKGVNEGLFSLEKLSELLTDKDYFDSNEARLRLAPEPDFDTL
jgi:hypothetical protein